MRSPHLSGRTLRIAGLLGVLLMGGCGRKPAGPPVTWSPKNPRPGDTLRITLRESAPSPPLLILQIFTPREGMHLVIQEMQAGPEGAAARIPLPANAALVNFKIEAGDRTYDENGLGYPVVVMRDTAKPMPTAHRWLGKLWEGGDLRPELEPSTEKAIRHYQEELRYYPQDPLARVWLWRLQNELLGNPTPSARQRAAIQELLSSPSPTPEALHAAAFFYWKMAGDLPRATDLTLRLLREHPDYGYGLELALNLAEALRTTEGKRRLLSAVATGWAGTWEGGEARYRLAQLLEDQGRAEEAIAAYREALQTYPHPEAFARLAHLLTEQGKLDEALAVIKEAEKIIPQSGFYDRAYPFFKGFKRRAWPESDLADLLSFAAELLEKEGKLQEALTYAQKAAALKAEFPPPEERYLLLGRIHRKLNHPKEAETALLKALSLDPTLQEAQQLLIALWKEQGIPDPEAALRKKLLQTLGLKLRPAPDLEVRDLDGKRVRLSDFRGKVVVLNFWATWCAPCRREIPDLNKLVEMYQNTPDVVFLAITDERPDVVQTFLQSQPFRYRILFSREGRRIYRVTGIPTHVILTPDGRVAFRHVGSFPNIHLRLQKEIETVRTLLAQPPA